MSLSFKPTSTSVALWWALAWRIFAWTFAFLIPAVLVLFVIYFIIAFVLVLGGMDKQTIKNIIGVLEFCVTHFISPVLMLAWVFSRLFRNGGFGGYTLSAAYNGAPVTTFKAALPYALWFYIENIKYTWPLYIASVAIGAGLPLGLLTATQLANILLLIVVLSLYLYLLVLTDLIKRRTFGRLQLVLKPATAKPAEAKPQAEAKPVAKPAAKTATKAEAKPAAKPVAKVTAKPAAKKPVAKAKPAAKSVKATAKAKPKAKK